MSDILEYKGYQAKITFDAEAKQLYGVIADISDHVDFISSSVNGIEKEFKKAVDDYVAFCEEVGKSPEKPYNGVFQVRTSPEAHKRLVQEARRNGSTLNSLVDALLRAHVAL